MPSVTIEIELTHENLKDVSTQSLVNLYEVLHRSCVVGGGAVRMDADALNRVKDMVHTTLKDRIRKAKNELAAIPEDRKGWFE